MCASRWIQYMSYVHSEILYLYLYLYFQIKWLLITETIHFKKEGQISQNIFSRYEWITSQHKPLIQHKADFPTLPLPFPHHFYSSPFLPWEDAWLFPFALNTTVAMETILLFFLFSSYQVSLWTQCQELHCTQQYSFNV